jgi:hypothetical protein
MGLAAAELGLEAGLVSSVMPELAAHTPAADASSAELEALAGIGSSALAAGRGSSDDSLIELNDLVSLGLAVECLDLAAGTGLTRRVGDRSGDGGPLSTTLDLDLTVGRAEGLPQAVRYCSSDRTLSPLRSMVLNSRSTVSNELLRAFAIVGQPCLLPPTATISAAHELSKAQNASCISSSLQFALMIIVVVLSSMCTTEARCFFMVTVPFYF